MRRLICTALLTAALAQGAGRWRTLYRASQGILIAANFADAHSSLGLHELNPILGRGHFGGRQVAIKGGIAGGWLIAQHLLNRRHRVVS